MSRARHLAALALCLAAGAAHADWRRDYSNGEQAYEKGDWAQAESLMKSAMAEEPGAAARKRMQGTRFALYAPAHYAGMAAYRQGSCERALRYFDDAGTRAVAAQVSSVASEQQEVLRACGGGGNVVATPTPRAPTPEPPKPAPPEVKPPVESPRAPVTPEPRTVAVEPPKPAPVEAPAPALTARVTAPAALRSIVGKFLAGDYPGALKVSDAGVGDTRARAMLLLVRAAAGFTLADLRGGDAALVAAAERDAQASRRLARLDPDPNLFSPKVRARLAKAR